MRKLSLLVASAVLAACSGSSSTISEARVGDPSATIDTVEVNGGALRIIGHDMAAASSTIPFPAPAISGTSGAIVATNAEFGGLCQYALSGSSDVSGSKVGIHVRLNPRLTLCTQELRVLAYEATLTIAAGSYDVAFVRELNGAQDTLARRSVIVR